MGDVFFTLGALSAGLGVAAGAFGAHGLKNILTPERLETYEKAVRYQTIHALALLAVALAYHPWPDQAALLAASGWLFTAGSVLFSGSLYALALGDKRWLGAVTPLGGLAFIAGWVSLSLVAW
jgi:uncharacterized membrane protein YgdD (TMEM256/DUF423 family)